jgi:arsenate reductase-like glutaredoxin family protein
MTCVRTQEFLAKNKIDVQVQVNAGKRRLGPADARALLEEADEVYIAKGKKIERFALKGADLDEIAQRMLGPTGNLRAPTVRMGRKVVVGFDPETYGKLAK